MSVSSLTITFTALGEGADSVTIELDDEANNNATSFLYGTDAYFLVFLDDSKYNYTLYATDGTIGGGNMKNVTMEIDVSFIDNMTQSVNYPIQSVQNFTWYGKTLGNIEKLSLFELTTTVQPDPSIGRIGTGKVTIVTQGYSHYINVPKKNYPEYPVVVIVYTTPKEQ